MEQSAAADRLFGLVQESRPNGLLTDIDGTISRIAGHPDDAVVEPTVRQALEGLSQEMTLVGAVSGRSAADAHRIVGIDSMVYSGNHGMELWRNNRLEQSPLAQRYSPHIAEVLERLVIPRRVDGIYVENKGLTASIHYRNVADQERVEAELLEEVTEQAAASGLRVTRGKMVIEIRPPVDLSKGTAVLELIKEYKLAGLLYLGDDVTDVDAFQALHDMRRDRGGHFYSIGVRSNRTPPEITEAADAMVPGVDGVLALLERSLSRG